VGETIRKTARKSKKRGTSLAYKNPDDRFYQRCFSKGNPLSGFMPHLHFLCLGWEPTRLDQCLPSDVHHLNLPDLSWVYVRAWTSNTVYFEGDVLESLGNSFPEGYG